MIQKVIPVHHQYPKIFMESRLRMIIWSLAADNMEGLVTFCNNEEHC